MGLVLDNVISPNSATACPSSREAFDSGRLLKTESFKPFLIPSTQSQANHLLCPMKSCNDATIQPRNRTILSAPVVMLSVVCILCATAGCSAIGTRIVDGGYFTGVRGDYDMMFRRETIDPKSRVHPVLAVVDMPFSCVADILFLPYDAFSGSQTPRDSSFDPIAIFADDIRRNIPSEWSVAISRACLLHRRLQHFC